MQRIYLVTGAMGHLGRNIITQLVQQKALVRGLLLPGENIYRPLLGKFEPVYGDVRDKASLAALFGGLADYEAVVIHTAAIVDISSGVSPRVYEVNVEGTKNMVALCLQYHVYRYIHVSSVHAIPEEMLHRQIREVGYFSASRVSGAYAKTKAEATQYVLDAVKHDGLPAVILHPSGIIGPLDPGSNNLVAAIRRYIEGKLPIVPAGGYDLVDVRDVAKACIAAADKGRIGETYILSGRHYEMHDIFKMLQSMGLRVKNNPCPRVPLSFIKPFASLAERTAARRKRAPLFTPYSLEALGANDNFTHEKASRELNFWPRDIAETLLDTVRWVRKTATPPPKKRRAQKHAPGTKPAVHGTDSI